ncbi:hypothetical protein [Actinomadura fibrosa]|uniref:Urease accessory protein UreD n=1 Tax=Actinomadura fibrosa TaxID=111802 RepID=A0ABW2XHM4_9ACTN|nr:hypothetical protein [Actinomadura fibrosa]
MNAVANHVRVSADDGLLVRWPAPLPDGERLVLRHTASGHGRAVNLAADRTSCALHVGDLGPGTWALHLEAGSLTRPLLTDDPGFSHDGLRAYAALPRRRSVRVTRSSDGHAALDVQEVEPHAEVELVHPRDGEIRIGGMLAYTGPRPGGARLLAVARKGSATVTGTARVHGTEFHARLSARGFATERPGLWDLWLAVADLRARLATLLDDAPGKRGKVSFPRQTVRDMSVRPYYTARDELAVACHRTEEQP